MHDINKIREEPNVFVEGLKKRGLEIDIETYCKELIDVLTCFPSVMCSSMMYEMENKSTHLWFRVLVLLSYHSNTGHT